MSRELRHLEELVSRTMQKGSGHIPEITGVLGLDNTRTKSDRPFYHQISLLFHSTDDRNLFEDKWGRFSRTFNLTSPTEIIQAIVERSLAVPAYVSMPISDPSSMIFTSKFRKHIRCKFETEKKFLWFKRMWLDFRQKFVEYQLTMSFTLAMDLIVGDLPMRFLSASPSVIPSIETVLGLRSPIGFDLGPILKREPEADTNYSSLLHLDIPLHQTSNNLQVKSTRDPFLYTASSPFPYGFHDERHITTQANYNYSEAFNRMYSPSGNFGPYLDSPSENNPSIYANFQNNSSTWSTIQMDNVLDLSVRKRPKPEVSTVSGHSKMTNDAVFQVQSSGIGTELSNLSSDLNEDRIKLPEALRSLNLPCEKFASDTPEKDLQEFYVGDPKVLRQLLHGVESHVLKRKCDESLRLKSVTFNGTAVLFKLICNAGHRYRYWFLHRITEGQRVLYLC